MKNNLKIWLFALGFGLLLNSCGGNKTTEPQVKEIKKDSIVTKVKKIVDRKYNDVARFISGMSLDSGANEYTELESKLEWMNYKKSFDSSWNVLENKRLILMRKWATTELSEPNKTSQTIFYPFSGPDFLNVTTLFPNGKQYILLGLEPVGTIADLKSFKDNELKNYLESISNSLGDIFKKSYFITKNMGKDMHSSEINGVTPLLYVFFARTGNRIISSKIVNINEQGVVADYDSSLGKVKSKGIKIEFIASGSDSIRTLYYFSVNVEDVKLKNNPGFIKFLDQLGVVTSYVKSASYLMHYLTFSIIRNAVLSHSSYVLQDDSGISYRFFDKKNWDISLYGVYTAPVADFKKQFEKDLSEAYTTNLNTKPVPFQLGYHWGTRGVNLLFAKRKQLLSN